MKAYTEKLHEELVSKLQALDKNYDPQNVSDPRLGLIAETIDLIKEKLKTHSFSSTKDEVQFFRFVLPPTVALYIYYTDKMEWDRVLHIGSSECRYKLIDRIYSQAETFRKEHSVFCSYCRDGNTTLDHFYFLRNSPANHEPRFQLRRIIDPVSPPLYSELLARLIAYNKMEHEVNRYICTSKASSTSVQPGKLKLRWTGKQIDFIELVYALKETGTLNNGNATLKEIFESFRDAFEIDPGNTSRLFQDIVTRKAGYTPYLDQMKKKLVERIEDVLD